MKYNPITQKLFTNDNTLLKKLHCSANQQWELMTKAIPNYKVCNTCSKAVYDTAFLSEHSIRELITNDAHVCLKVNLNQENIIITYTNHG